MGRAYNLLSEHVPEIRDILEEVMHFGAVRYGKQVEFESRLRKALTR